VQSKSTWQNGKNFLEGQNKRGILLVIQEMCIEKCNALQTLKGMLLVTGTREILWENNHWVDLEFDPHMSEIDLNLSVPLMIMKHFPMMILGTSNHIWIMHLMHLMNKYQGHLKELLNRVTPMFIYQRHCQMISQIRLNPKILWWKNNSWWTIQMRLKLWD